MREAVAARVSIDSSLCQGHGRCYSVVPELFGFDGEGYGVVLESAISADRVGLAHAAAIECPERAVVVDEAQSDDTNA
jgi:ferredoxin